MLEWWHRWTGVIVVALVAILGFALIWSSTVSGVWSSTDSSTYLGVARNLREGKGMTSPLSLEINLLSPDEQVALADQQPLTYWPPGYPAIIAFAAPFLSIESSARLIGSLSLAVTMGAMAWLIWRRTRAPAAAIIGPVLFGINLQMLIVYTAIASDPAFIAIVMAMLCVAVAQLSRPPGWRLGVVALLCTVSPLVRFVGVATLPVLLVTAFACLPGPRWRRAAIAGGITTAAALPFLIWRARVAGGPGYHPPMVATGRWDELPQWWGVAQNWLVPPGELHGGWTTAASIGLVVLLVASVAGLLWKVAKDRGWESDALLLLYALTYIPVMAIGGMVFDHGIPFDGRLLLPATPIFFVLGTIGITRLISSLRPTAARIAVGALVILAFVPIANWQLRGDDQRLWTPGLQGVWSPGVGLLHLPEVDAAGSDAVVFSNRPSAVYVLVDETPFMLPQKMVSLSGAPNPYEEDWWQQLVELSRQRPLVIVLVKGDFNGPDMDAQIKRHFAVEQLSDHPAFSVLRIRPGVTPP